MQKFNAKIFIWPNLSIPNFQAQFRNVLENFTKKFKMTFKFNFFQISTKQKQQQKLWKGFNFDYFLWLINKMLCCIPKMIIQTYEHSLYTLSIIIKYKQTKHFFLLKINFYLVKTHTQNGQIAFHYASRWSLKKEIRKQN